MNEHAPDRTKLLNTALILSIVTVAYNAVEGIVATFFGATDETLALFGFGVDSFVEVLSGMGILHMVIRMKQKNVTRTQSDRFEKRALRITGTAFYILMAGLVMGSALAIYTKAEPQTTLAGIIVSLISIATMYFLYRKKLQVGRKLDSAPIVSDAKCTKTCFYLSFILLGSSLLYELFRIPYVDAVGSLGIAWYAFNEGKEAFERARSDNLTCDDDCP